MPHSSSDSGGLSNKNVTRPHPPKVNDEAEIVPLPENQDGLENQNVTAPAPPKPPQT